MSKSIEALFDGKVFKPVEPLKLEPNTRVWIVITTLQPTAAKRQSFLRTARSLNLEGPADWSSNVENYLYGNKVPDED
jgi:predicted DNA-binding antitoxin AbrB/MazE fold protein